MLMKLVIVESPAKCAKIQGYLGPGWEVYASYGHFRDLPKNEMGVEPPDYFPNYEVTNAKQLNFLKSKAKEASDIYLATDPDREGEAIAWHLFKCLGPGNYKRITFNEITKSAVTKAVNNPRQVDLKAFSAQQARRVLDRLQGYKVSPALSNKLGQRGLSAGRVQSVALKLIVDREIEIANFSSIKHYGVVIDVGFPAKDVGFPAKWDNVPFANPETGYQTSKPMADRIAQTTLVTVVSCEDKRQFQKPFAPLITSTLQQSAANVLKMGAKETMQVAQKLYEAGLITYMRTDNPNLSDEAVEAIWALLRSRNLGDYIPDKHNKWKTKAGAQEAHEAIRPTDVNVYNPDTGDDKQNKLYQLIWKAAVASQMKAAEYAVRKIVLQQTEPENLLAGSSVADKTVYFTATAKKLVFAGFKKLVENDTSKDTDDKDDALPTLPKLDVGTRLSVNSAKVTESDTKPPLRYTAPRLIKKLESSGVGRPATYASIIETILGRQYVVVKKNLFHPTEIGTAVSQALSPYFDFMNLKYTAGIETQLDELEKGKANYRAVITELDQILDKNLSAFGAAQISQVAKEIHLCPDCQQEIRLIKPKQGKQFWGHVDYKNNDCPAKFENKGGKPVKRKALPTSDDYPCPTCKKGHLQRRPAKKKGVFWWGCDNYPDCKQTYFDDDGKPQFETKQVQIDKTYPCPDCENGYLQRRESKKKKGSFFWGCSNWKQGCKHIAWDDNGKPQPKEN